MPESMADTSYSKHHILLQIKIILNKWLWVHAPLMVQRTHSPEDARKISLGMHDLNGLLIQCAHGFSSLSKTILNGDENTLLFENLNPNTLYDVSITAIYPDESESEDLSGSEHTRRCLTSNQDLYSSKLNVKKRSSSCITNDLQFLFSFSASDTLNNTR